MSERAENTVVEMLVGLIEAWLADVAQDSPRIADIDRADMISLALDVWEQWPGRGGTVSGAIVPEEQNDG